MRVVFMGTPEFAVASLEAIIEAGMDVAAVVTAPDKPSGRGQKIHETAVKQCAQKHHLPILQPEKLKNTDFLDHLKSFNADLFVVVAFRMLPEEVWNMPPLGTVNLHASLLPQYRGAAPINWAIINGETKTGTTVFFIEKEIDTGNIISYREEPILQEDNAGSMHDKLMYSGAHHLVDAIQNIEKNNYRSIPQKLEMSDQVLMTAPKIFKETCKIDWKRNTTSTYNFIRGLSPYPAAWTYLISPTGEKLMLKIFDTEPYLTPHLSKPGSIGSDQKSFLHIATDDGWISVKSLQLEGKKRMPVEDFLRGMHDINNFRIETGIE
ncbi:MAG: methionyl-tRNA formyltransferase [Bacteroidales bacterium]|jgi:methionyl-tRNA formyltransferase|nr:methionyl-tRNA formyltransferase [Bacteroidales bacterium]